MQTTRPVLGNLNSGTMPLIHQFLEQSELLKTNVHTLENGGTFIDCGIKAPGGHQSGILLARCTMANLGSIQLVPSHLEGWKGSSVQVQTDHPILACLASQYAGWQISVDDFFAMGSGPMRAHYASEPIFNHIPGKETASHIIGVLETSALPGAKVFASIASKTGLTPKDITLLGASTGSIAGSTQIVARSVETALHKLHELRFPMEDIQHGIGWAPLSPPTPKFNQAIGRTNDAILYGALVHLWVNTDDSILEEIGPKVPSCSSGDYGSPFEEIFRRVNGDFYKIDPMLFSPGRICFMNQKSGRSFTFGQLDPDLLARSWGQPNS